MPSCTTCPAPSVQNASGNWVQPSEYDDAVALESDQLQPDLEQKLDGVYSSTAARRLPDLRLQLPDHRRRADQPQKGAVEGRFIMFLACKGQQSAGRSATRPCHPTSWRTISRPSARIAGAAPPPSAPTASNCQNPYVDGSTPLPGQPNNTDGAQQPRRHRRQEHPRRRRKRQQPQTTTRRPRPTSTTRPRPPGQLEPPRVAARKAPTEGTTAPEASAGRLLRCTDDDAALRRGPPRGGQRSRQIVQRHELHAGLGSGSAPVGRHSPGNSADPAQTRPWSTGTRARNASLPTTNCFCDRRSLFWSRPHLRGAEPRHDDRGRSSGHASQVTATSSSPGKKAACATGFVCETIPSNCHTSKCPSVELGPVKDLGIGQYVFIKFRNFPPTTAWT